MGTALSIPHIESKYYQDFVTKLPSLKGQTIAITGTTTGLGNVAARTCVLKGARVLLLNRPSERATVSSQELEEVAGGFGSVQAITCDLQSFASVRTAAAQVASLVGEGGLDVLCNNAGIAALRDQATPDGYEIQMHTNHLSHFLLTSLLMPCLEAAAKRKGSARVVNHTSAARKYTGSPISAKYLQKGTEFGGDLGWGSWERYHQSKLANAVFTLALQDRLIARQSKVVASAAAPGVAASSIATTTASQGGGIGLMLLHVLSAQSAEDGCLPLLQCIAAPDVPKGALYVPACKGFFGFALGDGVFGPPKLVTPPEALCTREDSKSMLWQLSENAVGAFFPP